VCTPLVFELWNFEQPMSWVSGALKIVEQWEWWYWLLLTQYDIGQFSSPPNTRMVMTLIPACYVSYVYKEPFVSWQQCNNVWKSKGQYAAASVVMTCDWSVTILFNVVMQLSDSRKLWRQDTIYRCLRDVYDKEKVFQFTWLYTEKHIPTYVRPSGIYKERRVSWYRTGW
jgi:hypothetical protein